MKLMKDLADERIIFYWIDSSEERLSPSLATLDLAKEWRDQRMFDSYPGAERRSSIIDRRSNRNKRESMTKSHRSARTNPQGRRITDIPVAVDVDLVKEKLQEFY